MFHPVDKKLPVEMLYVFCLTDLPKLDIQVFRGADFEAWKAQWMSHFTLSGLADHSATTKVQVLTLCLLRESLTIVNNLSLTEEQKQDTTAIITTIKRHIDEQINESVEQCNLHHRKQQPGESINDSLVALCELARRVTFAQICAHRKTYGTKLLKETQMECGCLFPYAVSCLLPVPCIEYRLLPV